MSLRNSTFDVTYTAACFFLKAWKDVKDMVFEKIETKKSFGNVDIQMLIYQYNVILPTMVNFLDNVTSSVDILFDALYDLAHVLCTGNTTYFSILLRWLANMQELKTIAPVYFREVIEKNPHFLIGIGIELLHGDQARLTKNTSHRATEKSINVNASAIDLFHRCQAFMRQYHGEHKAVGGSYTRPLVETEEGERFYAHKVVARKAIFDGFLGALEGKTIDVENTNYDTPVRYLDTTSALPDTVIVLGATLPGWGISFKLKGSGGSGGSGGGSSSRSATTSSSNVGTIIIDFIDAGAANGKSRKANLSATVAAAGDTVLGLCSGCKHVLEWDAKDKSTDALLTEMNRRRTLGNPVNLLIQCNGLIHHKRKGDKMISKARGSYNGLIPALIL
jgi:hypothetical protein